MKYLWIFMIAIPLLIWCIVWSIASIIDIIGSIKQNGIFDFICCIDYSTEVWLTLIILGIFLYNLYLWIAA